MQCHSSNKPSVVPHFASPQPWLISLFMLTFGNPSELWFSLSSYPLNNDGFLCSARPLAPTTGTKTTDCLHDLILHHELIWRQQQIRRRLDLYGFDRTLVTVIPFSWLSHSSSTSFGNLFSHFTVYCNVSWNQTLPLPCLGKEARMSKGC